VENLHYDMAGRLADDGFWTYRWDGASRLIGMTRKAVASAQPTAVTTLESVNFGYDADGRRTSKSRLRLTKTAGTNGSTGKIVANSTEMSKVLWAGWLPVMEDQTRTVSGVTGVTTRRWFQWGADLSGTLDGAGGIGGLVGIIEEDGAGLVTRTLLPVQDGLGNITAVIDQATGRTVARYDYGPFGEPLAESGEVDACPFRWQTKWYDAESQHYYFGYRHYDPRFGRWLSRDPLGEAGGFNLYAYCGNDPVNRHDPLGLSDSDSPYGAFQRARARGIWLTDNGGTPEQLAAALAAETVLPGDPRAGSMPTSAKFVAGVVDFMRPSQADLAFSPSTPIGNGFGHNASLTAWSFYNSFMVFISIGSDPSRLITGKQLAGAEIVNREYMRQFTYRERSFADLSLFVASFAAPTAVSTASELAQGVFGGLRGLSLGGEGFVSPGGMLGAWRFSEAGGVFPRTVRPAFVAAKGLPPLRQAYVAEVEALKDLGFSARAAGQDVQATARMLNAERDALKVMYRDMSPAEKVLEWEARNMNRYGNPLGPTIDQLRAQGKTWEQIIESASRPGGGDVGF